MKQHIYYIGIILSIVSLSLISCSEQDYTCNCSVDGPDTGNVSMDYDTNLTVTANREDIANTECEAYEGASSVLIPNNAATQQFTVACDLQ